MIDVGHQPLPHDAELARQVAVELSEQRGPSGRSRAFLRTRIPSWPRPSAGEMPASQARKVVLGSDHPFRGVDRLLPVDGADPPRSFALGGLSTVWGAACYAFSRNDLVPWPIDPATLEAHYSRAVELLGVDQSSDALASAYPLFGHEVPAGAASVRRNRWGLESVLTEWRANEARLGEAGIHVGRSRLAVRLGSGGCVECGLCLTGCPVGAIFSSAAPVLALRSSRRFRYHADRHVLRFHRGNGDLELDVRDTDGRPAAGLGGFDRVVLAAGALGSFRIAAESLGIPGARAPVLDNEMLVVPFRRSRRGALRPPFALSEAAASIETSAARLHLQLYSAHTHFLGALGQSIENAPAWLASAPRWLLSHLAVGFLYLPSTASRTAVVQAMPSPGGEPWRLRIDSGAAMGTASFAAALDRVRASPRMGLRPLASLARRTAFGSSGHLAGTLPLRERAGPLETDRDGRLGGEPRVIVADASVFPALPAQNPTLTVVANALRVTTTIASS